MSKTGNTYSEEFRREAVELLRSSGRPLKRVASELGISANTLRNWRDRRLGQSEGRSLRAGGEQRPGEATAQELFEENRQLRRELEHIKRQRDILKKAASILAEDPQLGMR